MNSDESRKYLSRRDFVRRGLQGCAAGYAASVLSGCCPSPSTIAQTSQNIDTAVQGAMSQYGVSSVSYALMSCGQIVTAHAFGTAVNLPFFPGGADLRPVQATPATVYQAASLSKTLAAVASLWVTQHGQLTLDADVTNSETSWKLPPGQQNSANPVTLRRLLGMTAGTNVHGFAGYAINCTSSSCPLPTLIQILNGTNPPANNAAIQVTVTPGTQWIYSGGGYEVVHSLLQDVSGGTSYASMVENNILSPLKMTSSTLTIPLPSAQMAQAAAGFIAPNGQIANLWNTYPELAAAGLWTTPSDMARLLLEISVAYEGGKGIVLTQASAQAMMTQVDSSQYGLGGAVRNPGTNNVLFMKNGSNLGFTSWFLVYPQIGSGLVIMSNYDEDTNTPANWTNLFGSAASAAVSGLGWSNFPGLADQG